MDRNEIRDQLKALRRSLEAPFRKAKDAGNQAEMDRLQGIALEIDRILASIALESLGTLAASLAELKGKINGKTAEAEEEANSFGASTISKLEKEIKRILDESAEEVAEAAPPVQVEALNPPEPAPKAKKPKQAATGALVLTEAHLIALWKRSQFPISGHGIIVFGLRGARPVVVGGTGLAPEHEITITPVNYETMNCTMGQWLPGQGLALFPGSTVPFGATVKAKIAADGVGANQMGRGRYKRYDAGWHKRSEGENGHWALLQGSQITLQRTGDDADFDLKDRWEVGWKAGDNIHCAFHMGSGADVPNARFSSAGCQTVAGTVKKGVRGSEAGPWAKFIAPFLKDTLGSQKQAEYVLFAANEAQEMIRTECAGKTVVLRYGSQGPLVEALQSALNDKAEAGLKVDGDFGPGTFRALVDFQTVSFGDEADDGIVGPQVAAALGIDLPLFDFDDAIAGGPGHKGPARALNAGSAGTIGSVDPEMELVWGKITRKKHGAAFNAKVVEISNRLKCDPNNLMAVMAFETGDTFDPAIKNAAGSGATGLIQFMPKTAKGLGTTTAKLAKMSGVEQLDFVEKHFKSVAGNRALPQLSDVYMAVLLPVMIGKPDSAVLFRKGTTAYTQNKGLDVDNNGSVTKLEASAKVQERKERGRTKTRFG